MIRLPGARRAIILALGAAIAYPAVTSAFVSHKLVSGGANITVPSSGTGIPYPSSLNVDGLDGVIESMTVTFFVTHATPDDLDILVVGPNGAKVVLMSDVGGTADLSNKQVRFKDGAAVMPDDALIDQVEYRPTNVGGTDTFPAPAPGGTAATTLGAAFGGINPNGQWRLFVIDDSAGTGGTVNSWRVTITTRVTIQGAGATIPSAGPAGTYPSLISIGKLRGKISRVEVRINGLNHNNPDDLDVLLLGPSGERVRLMSDSGGNENRLTNVNLVFADAAKSELPNGDQIVSGTYKPTNHGFGDDNFPRPAPGTPYEDDLSTFNGDRAEGNWRLFVSDDESPTSGSFANWSLTFVTVNNPPSINSIPNQTIGTGGARNVAITASDGEGDPLQFSESLPNFITLEDNGNGTATMRLRPDPGDAGTYNNLQLRVEDGEFSTSQTFNLTVTDASSPDTSATVDPASNAAGWNNTDVTVHVNATDADSPIDFIRYSASGALEISSTDDPGPAVDVPIVNEGVTDLFHQARDSAMNLGVTEQKTVRIDKTAPAMSHGPGVHLAAGQLLGAGGTVPLTVEGWAGSDPGAGTIGSGLDRFTLAKSIDGGAAVDVALPTKLATSVATTVTANSSMLFTAGAVDVADNASSGAAGVTLIPRIRQEAFADIVDTGSWTTQSASFAAGGGTQFATSAGAKVTFTFTGRKLAWVSSTGPDRGKANVFIDSVQVGSTVDLFAAGVTGRLLVFASDLTPGAHTIEVRVTGTKNAASSGTRVDVDAIIVVEAA